MRRRVLEGVRVLDWTTMAAGPGATAILADFGATVLKVEPPKGDPWRRVLSAQLSQTHLAQHTQQEKEQRWKEKDARTERRVEGDARTERRVEGAKTIGRQKKSPTRSFGPVFEHDNRGKLSLQLDLSCPHGKMIFLRLLGTCDVLVTNTRVAATQRLGLDFESLQNKFPALVYAHITAWGRSGPMRDAPGYDAGAFWAATGMLDLLSVSEDSPPVRLPGAAGDHTTSLALVAGIALALFHHQRTGRGQLVDVSLLRAGLWANSMFLSASAVDSKAAGRILRDPYRIGPTFRAYKCRCGETIHLLGYQTNRHTPSLLKALGLQSMPTDPIELDRIFASKDAHVWEALFDRFGVWYTRVTKFDMHGDIITPAGIEQVGIGRNKRGAMSCVAEQAEATGGFLRRKGAAALVACPIQLHSGPDDSHHSTSTAMRARAPMLGEHNLKILLDAGFSRQRIAELQKLGAFGPPSPQTKTNSKL